MKYIWRLVEGVENESRQKNIFLAVNAIVWGLLFFAVSIPVVMLTGRAEQTLIFALCAAGYGSILVGIYGGIFYLYRNI